jgi:acyl-CoA thioesterase-2
MLSTVVQTKAQRARFALDPLLNDMAIAEKGRTAARSAVDADVARVFAAGILAARAMIDAGKDVGFSRWIHAVAVTYRDPAIGSGDLVTDIGDRDEREGSSSRSLFVQQGGRELARASVAFEDPPIGRHHPHLYGIGDAPDPHTLMAQGGVVGTSTLPVDVRPIDWDPLSARERGLDAPVRSWFRFTQELPDDLLLHSSALALCVDALISRNLLDINAYNTVEGNPAVQGWCPLTYSLWIHRCFRADDWILATEKSASIFGNRAFFSVTLKSSQGRHVATAVQELQLVRPST